MTKIHDILGGELSCSFEFFPPRTDEAAANLEQAIRDLRPVGPSYVSVTYGAGGSTRDRTHDLVVRLNTETELVSMAHLTCAAHTSAELNEIVERYADAGIENILALGGDLPDDADLPPGELAYAIDLVRLVRSVGNFSIGVAAHPEPHPRSPDKATDRRNTAAKLAEADFAITQFFFEAEHYFELVDALAGHNVEKPVIAGIMPVVSLAATRRMAELQGSEFPAWLYEKLAAVGDDPEAVRAVGVEEATKLCAELVERGAPGLHFYTLNGSTATLEICHNLGLAGAGTSRGVRSARRA